jgi:hypothetical protein
MDITSFVDNKSRQLCYYIRAYWQGLISHKELELFFWDIMEEWTHIQANKQVPYSTQERVFWHLLHQIHYWPAEQLHTDMSLREDLEHCLKFLEGKGYCPFDCVGIRP